MALFSFGRDNTEAHLIRAHLISIENIATAILNLLTKGFTHMSAALDSLTAQVTAQETVEASAITLIQGIAEELKKAGTDPAALSALQTRLSTSAANLAAAVSANTPAAP